MLTFLIEFIKIGLLSIGGGLATFPFLVEMTEKYTYFTYDELLTMLAVSESTPGAIGINMATFAGIKAFSYGGGILAVLALISPSLIITILLSKMLRLYRENEMVKNTLSYLQAASIGFIFSSILPIFMGFLQGEEGSRWIPLALWFVGILFLREKIRKLHPGLLILGALCIGIVLDLLI